MQNRPGERQNDDRRAYLIDFIDPLFAGSLAIGLTEGIMTEQWFRAGRFPTGVDATYFWTYILGLSTIVLSWAGYHESIKTKPLHGFGRFLIDVVLVLLYAVLIVQYKNIGTVLFLLAVIHVLFFLWDIFKIIEYKQKYEEKGHGFLTRYGRELVTFYWMFLFIGLSVARQVFKLEPETVLYIAFAFTLLYRIDKKYVLPVVLKRELRDFLFGK